MHVIKRSGLPEAISFTKIAKRIQNICDGLDFVDPIVLSKQISTSFYHRISTVKLDQLLIDAALCLSTEHGDYTILAKRIAISKLHKETTNKFSEAIAKLYHAVDPKTNKSEELINKATFDLVQKHGLILNSAINDQRDFIFDYYGFKTLEQSYLLKINGQIVERPQHLLMRVAIAIHGDNVDRVIETYDYMSEHYFIHATPTLFSACAAQQQMVSCFILPIIEDSIQGIFETVKQCALISHSAGGIGLSVHCVRANGAIITTSNGKAKGLVPMLRVLDSTSLFTNLDATRRSGMITVYVEPWHADIFEFLELKKSTGKEEIRAKELFYGLWIPDLFMRRVLENGMWSLMCPHESPGLFKVWGEEFEKLYTRYEKEGRYRRQIQARDLWNAIIHAQVETGMPSMLYKDHCNGKSNHAHLGTIKCSSACAEILQYSCSQEVAACSLASISVKKFVNSSYKEFDFKHLKEITKVVTRNLDSIIDISDYPIPEAKKSALQQRPIGIGIQGLADAFLLMQYPFESEEAQSLNLHIFETLYYGALEASCELAKEKGKYPAFDGSPISKGILQFDMWDVTPTDLWNWSTLKEEIAKHGIRNSLLISAMPTASTAQIFGNNESTKPYASNIFSKRINSREHCVVNPHLLKDLLSINVWDEDIKNEIIANNGSIQNISRIPSDMKLLYKTAWEIPQKSILKMAIDRGAFIDQSESLNIHMSDPTPEKITSMHFYSWNAGLKTGMHILQTVPGIQKYTDEKTISKLNELNVK